MKFKLTTLLLLSSSILFAQRGNSEQTKSYDTIIQSGSKEQKDALTRELLVKARGAKKESELELVSNYLYRLGYQDSSDSLRTVIAKKFPKGLVARANYINNVYGKQEGLKEKEKSYQHILKVWPINPSEEIKIAYDYIIADLAKGNIEEGNTKKALSYLTQLNERFWRAQGYMPVATKLLQKGDTATALPLIQTAIDDAEYYINLPKDKKDNRAGFAAVGYSGYVADLVAVYTAQGKSAQSIALIEKALKLAPQEASRFSASYFKALDVAGRKLEALQQLEILYKKGTFSYKDDMKRLYTLLNGSDLGYDAYLARLDFDVLKGIKEHIAKSEQFKKAPDFELLNLKGESVSLASLKGKVVVLDFWATWCQPCINSFPGMQAAQQSFSNDQEVQFLFINTWERDKDYKAKVPAFIEKHNYPFEVLYDDQKNEETGKNLAATFGVSGIPAKFIIDKEGNIRYALTGSSANVDYIKLEMSALIESAKKPHK